VVLAYYLPGLEGQLVLSRELVVAIYNGTVTQWNDSAIEAMNPNMSLPERSIRVVARADFSGTTEIFTSALSSFSSEWNRTYGTFADGLDADEQPIHWNSSVVRFYGRTNRGMTGMVFSYLYSIGYMSVAEAKSVGWTYAKLVNRAGNVVDINAKETYNVIAQTEANLEPGVTGPLVDSDLDFAYPILGYTYIIVRLRNLSDCATATELYRYAEWFLFDEFATEVSEDLGMVTVTKSLAHFIVEEILNQMQCGDSGDLVKDLVKEQKKQEAKSTQAWRIPLYIALPVGIVLITSIVVIMLIQQVRLRKALLTDDWLIPRDQVWGVLC
jgi:ABC-type phosphate transport system substrate-binding protein